MKLISKDFSEEFHSHTLQSECRNLLSLEASCDKDVRATMLNDFEIRLGYYVRKCILYNDHDSRLDLITGNVLFKVKVLLVYLGTASISLHRDRG